MAATDRRTVRVVAGEYRGRILTYPRERILRPTMTKTKESVFSALQQRLQGAVFVDLFCAAGSMGIEALSRGAAVVWFVERDKRALECLDENLKKIGPGDSRVRVYRGDAFEFLRCEADRLTPGPVIIYADPPYDSGDAENVLAHFARNPYPQLDVLVIEHGAGGAFDHAGPLVMVKQKRFGDTFVSYYEAGDD